MSDIQEKELNVILDKYYKDWSILVDEGITIWKEFMNKDNKPIVVLIDETGATLMCDQKQGTPLSHKEWQAKIHKSSTETYLAEYISDSHSLDTNNKLSNIFDKETLQTIYQHTLYWNKVIS